MFLFVIIIVLFLAILLIQSNKIIKENNNFLHRKQDNERNLKYIEDKILNMNGYEFEQFMGRLFKMSGYKVIVTPSSNDNGRDIELYKDGQKIFVECKHYSNTSVSSPMINKLVGSCTIFGADKAIFITTSDYTKAALNLIKMSPIEVDRWYLDDIIGQCDIIGSKKIIGVL